MLEYRQAFGSFCFKTSHLVRLTKLLHVLSRGTGAAREGSEAAQMGCALHPAAQRALHSHHQDAPLWLSARETSSSSSLLVFLLVRRFFSFFPFMLITPKSPGGNKRNKKSTVHNGGPCTQKQPRKAQSVLYEAQPPVSKHSNHLAHMSALCACRHQHSFRPDAAALQLHSAQARSVTQDQPVRVCVAYQQVCIPSNVI